jgi:hypothetical protein
MKKVGLLKKIAKLGLKVQEGYNGKHFIYHKGQIASWYYQEAYGEVDGEYQKLEGVWESRGHHIRSEGDESDPHTDYFAGCFCENATQLLNYLIPPVAKFPVGTLVRGKSNKRATRQGYAGKTGLVIKSGTYLQIDWLGEEKRSYTMSYPERDIELVSAA